MFVNESHLESDLWFRAYLAYEDRKLHDVEDVVVREVEVSCNCLVGFKVSAGHVIQGGLLLVFGLPSVECSVVGGLRYHRICEYR